MQCRVLVECTSPTDLTGHCMHREYMQLSPELAPLPVSFGHHHPGCLLWLHLSCGHSTHLPCLQGEGPSPVCLLTTREKIKLLTEFPSMNLCQGGLILLISLWGWLKVMPKILLEKKKRKVVAQGGRIWKTKHLKLLPRAGMGQLPHQPALFVCMTSEHGGIAPAWTRGLLAYGNTTDFNREWVPSCQGY